jgi:hypothetical protein
LRVPIVIDKVIEKLVDSSQFIAASRAKSCLEIEIFNYIPLMLVK